MMHYPRIITGCPRDEWAHVQAIQDQPFIYIQFNGSKWAGEQPDGIPELIDVLGNHQLDLERFSVSWTDDPCRGVVNPSRTWGNSQSYWIDGDRLYRVDGVTRFYGNFIDWSHGFCIDTNDPDTISRLKTAISANRIRSAA